jgi:hypothetical protein
MASRQWQHVLVSVEGMHGKALGRFKLGGAAIVGEGNLERRI